MSVNATTIKIHAETKLELDRFREYKNESYDEVIKKIVFIANNADSDLSRETLEAIKNARKRIRKGKFVTEEEARKRLDL